VTYAAAKPGHAVVHEGRTALFDDATAKVVVLDSTEIAGGLDAATDVREFTSPDAHHGVAVELTDGTLVVSVGTEDARTGIQVLDATGAELASSDECPGVHGEAVAAGEAVVIGSEESTVVLGDDKSDPDAELERPTRVALIDTVDGDLCLVDLPSSYTFRSLVRDDEGNGLVLGTDGQVHVIDVEKGELVRSIPVIDAWEEPTEWQEPRPTIFWLDGSAYVSDPANNRVHAVDIESGEIWLSGDLTVTPNELNGVTGAAPHTHDDHAEDDHDDHDHDEHDDEDADA